MIHLKAYLDVSPNIESEMETNMHRTDSAGPNQHALPHAGAMVAARERPFVGNESVEDNLCECAKIAIWNAIGHAGSEVIVTAASGAIHVSGTIDTNAHRNAAIEAIRKVVKPTQVVDETAVSGASEPSLPGDDPAPVEMSIVRVREFCSLSDASLSAAIKDAIRRIDAAFLENDLPPTMRIVLIFRNLTASTVTLDVGSFAGPSSTLAEHGLVPDIIPGKELAQIPVRAGVEGLIVGQSRLLSETGRTNHSAVWWEILETQQFRPWSGLPDATLRLAV